MKRAYIPRDVLAEEIRLGRVTTGGVPIGGGMAGVAVGVAEAMAARSLERSTTSSGKSLVFPNQCCNCLSKGDNVRPVKSVSIVARGVPYSFDLLVPHCADCQDTAGRKRLGSPGIFAIFFAVSVLVSLAVAGAGELLGQSIVTSSSVFVGLILGLAAAGAAPRVRRRRGNQASAYQAVFASGLDLEFSGAPKGAVLSFANDTYAGEFIEANRGIGVEEK